MSIATYGEEFLNVLSDLRYDLMMNDREEILNETDKSISSYKKINLETKEFISKMRQSIDQTIKSIESALWENDI